MLKKILELDARITEHLRITESQSKLRPFGIFLAHSGDSWFILLALFAVWLFTRGFWHTLTAFMAVAAVGLAIVVLVTKFLIRRKRPEGDWGAIYRNTDPHSFPSGHAARTAMLALIALLVGPLWLGITLLIWAPLVSLARVWMGVHYVSDVIAGFILGVIAALVVHGVFPWLVSTFPFPFVR
jgi:membrane-associated phospholipid phosphatase